MFSGILTPAENCFIFFPSKSSIKMPTMTMQCEKSGEYKPPKMRKNPNLQGTGSRKCECSFRLRGFFEKDTNDWWVAILSGIHNYELTPKLST